MKRFLFTAAILGLTLTSCSKSDDPTPASDPTTLIAKNWKNTQTDLLVDGKVGTALYKEGAKDNPMDMSNFKMNLSSNGTFVESDVDDQGKPYQDKGTWKLIDSNKKLQLTYEDKTVETYDITSLTSNELQVKAEQKLSSVSQDDDFGLAFIAIFLGITPKESLGLQMKFKPQ
ncbi:lipocalin-like domain-containing protein [Rudanella paleaurantiibacter]|nr:lipocalin family protein [Rudanella paleaurantiibacter]